MELNFLILKQKFLESLQQQGKLQGKVDINTFDISIFDYSEEFNDYVQSYVQDFNDDLNLDFSKLPENYEDILNLDLNDPSLYDFDEETEYSQNNHQNFVSGMLNDILNNEDVIKKLDADGDGKLSDDEISNFVDLINKNDGNENQLSYDDLVKGMEQLKDDSFNPFSNIDNIDEIDDATTDDVSSDTDVDGTDGSDHKPSGTDNGNNGSDTLPDNSGGEEETKDYSKMSLEDLTSEKSTKESEVKTASEDINKVYAGTNEAVKTAEENAEKKKLAYDEAVEKDEKISAELKEKRTINLNSITDQETIIDDLKTDLNNKENEINEKTSKIENLNSTIASLEASLSKLSTQSSEDSEIQAAIETKKGEVSTQLEQAKIELQTAQTEKEKAEQEKVGIEKQITEEEGVLTELETEKTEIEKEISANCDETTKQAMADYNTAKQSAETIKEQELAKAQENLKTKKAELDKIEEAYNTKEAAKLSKENSVRTTKEVFDPNTEMTIQHIENEGELPYLLIGPKDVDPNADLPVLLYLHGSGEFGSSLEKLETVGPGKIIPEWNLENFNGYIICPLASKESGLKNWENEKALGYVDRLLTDFEETHNVDSERISIAGHSMGGKGTEYLAVNMPGRFYRAAVLSGFYSDARMDTTGMEVRGYVGSGDSEGSKKYMNNGFVNEVGYENLTIVNGGHGRVPHAALTLDKNNNGRSDFIEFLFGEID